MSRSVTAALKASHALFVTGLIVACGLETAVAAGPNNPFQVGAWHAGAYTNDQNGSFSHCSAGVSYKSQIVMFVAVNRAMTWSLGFTHPQWAFTKGDRIPVQLRFDGGTPYNETGVVLVQSPALVQLPMPDDS
jgi:hypothetical protein